MAPQSSSTHRSKTDNTMRALLEREKELKRTRGEVACAECRRLKLRCDRKLPCSSCVRRGCPSICPNGVLTGGSGTRFVLADTEELHLKLVDMSERIRELEDALLASHTRNSDQPHPLLCLDLQAIKFVVGHNISSEKDIPGHTHDPLEAFGSLKISDDGETRFIGPSGVSERILLSEEQIVKSEEEEHPHEAIPSKLYELARMWPFTPVDLPKDDLRAIIEAQLPTLARASALCESYLENIGWYNMPIDRQQLMEEIIPAIYKHSPSMSGGNGSSLSDLTLLLIVLACGAAADRTQEPKNDEGQLYYYLTRAALGLQPVLESSSLSTVQVITLVAVYDIVAIRSDDLEVSWKTISLAASIAGSIGLHRDPGRWKLEPKIIERRRRVFWDMYLVHEWQCLAGGRPPAFVTSCVDVQLPKDSEDGDSHLSPELWKLRFLKECIAPVTDRICADSTPLKYYEILNLDKKIQDFSFGEVENIYNNADHLDDGDHDIVSLTKRNRVLFYKSMLRLYLHREAFVRVITKNGDNPDQPPLGTSFTTVFSNAVSVLERMKRLHTHLFGWITRFWSVLSHVLECGFVVGSVAVRCPRTSYADTAYKSLETAIELFHYLKHPVSRNGLPVLLRLQERARQAKYATHIVPSSLFSYRDENAIDEGNDELHILRGASRVVSQKSSKRSTKEITNTPSPLYEDSPSSSGSYPLSNGSPDYSSALNVEAQSQSSNTEPEVSQITATDLANAGTFSWSDVFGKQDYGILPQDFTMNMPPNNQAFANLQTDSFLDGFIPTQPWNFEPDGNTFSF